MKTVRILNAIAISLPFLLLSSYPFFEDSSIVYSLLSTIFTGVLQVILAIYLLFKKYKQEKITIYLVSVITFFTVWFIVAQIDGLSQLGLLLVIVPPILAIYLSNIIYSKN